VENAENDVYLEYFFIPNSEKLPNIRKHTRRGGKSKVKRKKNERSEVGLSY
jgi:hypothetical protein